MQSYRLPKFHERTPAAEVNARLEAFRIELTRLDFDAALLAHGADILYFTGSMQAGYLLVPADGEPVYMVRRDIDRARTESPLRDVVELTGFSSLRDLVTERLGGAHGRIGLELDLVPVNLFRKLKGLWPEVEVLDVSPVVMSQRAVKSDWELDWMRKAGNLGEAVYASVPDHIRPGRTEIEVAGLITADAYRGGHQNMLRMRGYDSELHSWHVIAGDSGCIHSRIDAAFGGYGLSPAFPMGAGQKPIRNGDSILIDFGTCLNGYQVDQTRMFSLGPPDDRIRTGYDALVKIQKMLVDRLRPGVLPSDLFSSALALGEELGIADYLFGVPGKKVRFAGHGVGLEINEFPVLATGFEDPVRRGMTVALELKMVIPGLGAVGLENTYAVTEGTPENLTPADETLTVIDR